MGSIFSWERDFPYQANNPGNPNFSEYITRTFTKDHVVPKTMRVLVEDLAGPERGNRLLDIMVHNGKKQYILRQLLPHTPDSLLFEHSTEQMQWLREE